MAHDLFKVPNLISLGRLLLLIPAAYFLGRPGLGNKLYALACLAVAAISDYFDGYFARRLNQKTKLGLFLDPLSDKILAATLVVLLVIHRQLPVWLAVVIVGRDALIASGGMLIKSRLQALPPSNLTGKYCFASTALLLISYVIGFDFGTRWLVPLVLVLIAGSILLYTRALVLVLRGEELPVFRDRPIYRITRNGVAALVAIIYLIKLAEYIGWI
jgi:CDP-diacylglycerol--glycerol-3-phosphate 3-phosphatidyltransferase